MVGTTCCLASIHPSFALANGTKILLRNWHTPNPGEKVNFSCSQEWLVRCTQKTCIAGASLLPPCSYLRCIADLDNKSLIASLSPWTSATAENFQAVWYVRKINTYKPTTRWIWMTLALKCTHKWHRTYMPSLAGCIWILSFMHEFISPCAACQMREKLGIISPLKEMWSIFCKMSRGWPNG